MKNRKLLDITYIAMAAAIMAICSFIAIPAAVSVTMQTFAVLLVSALLGAKRGVAAVAVYLLLGAIGLPVFSNFSGGIGHLTGVGGGYLFGFLATAAVVGGLSKTKIPLWASMTLGVLVCYITGTLWYAFIYSSGETFWQIASACVLPYIVPDIIKICLSILTVNRLKGLDLIK